MNWLMYLAATAGAKIGEKLRDKREEKKAAETKPQYPQSTGTDAETGGVCVPEADSRNPEMEEKQNPGILEIPEGVTKIAGRAYLGRDDITGVVIPASVKEIGHQAFGYCRNLSAVSFSEGLECMETSAFSGCTALTSVSIPGSVTSIGCFAFRDCTHLRSVELQEGIRKIGGYAFQGCSSLRSVSLPRSLETVSGEMFAQSGLREPVLDAAGEGLVFCPANIAAEEYSVPSGIRRICAYAFLDLPDLKKVHLPDTLEWIERAAFCRCGIREAAIPAGVTEIAAGAFLDCPQLQSIALPDVTDAFAYALEQLRLRGRSLLRPMAAAFPTEPYWTEPSFRTLAERCASGDGRAMESLAAFFLDRAEQHPEQSFYLLTANLWMYKAYVHGGKAGREYLWQWLTAHPATPLDTMLFDGNMDCIECEIQGEHFNAMGFFWFAPEQVYDIAALAGGIVSAQIVEDTVCYVDDYEEEMYLSVWHLDSLLSPVPSTEQLAIHCWNGAIYDYHDWDCAGGKLQEGHSEIIRNLIAVAKDIRERENSR